MFLKAKDLVYMKANGIISMAANTRLGVIPQPHCKKARRCDVTV